MSSSNRLGYILPRTLFEDILNIGGQELVVGIGRKGCLCAKVIREVIDIIVVNNLVEQARRNVLVHIVALSVCFDGRWRPNERPIVGISELLSRIWRENTRSLGTCRDNIQLVKAPVEGTVAVGSRVILVETSVMSSEHETKIDRQSSVEACEALSSNRE